jgi:predicted trehalose synthase
MDKATIAPTSAREATAETWAAHVHARAATAAKASSVKPATTKAPTVKSAAPTVKSTASTAPAAASGCLVY